MKPTRSWLSSLSVIGLAVPLGAAAPPALAQSQTPPSASSPRAQTSNPSSKDQIQQMQQRHLAQLHREFGITANEEAVWQRFAEASTQNATDLDSQYKDRAGQLGSMNAVQNMRSYAAIETKRADNMTALVTPFQQLYEALTPAQRKSADEMFRNNGERAAARKLTSH